MKKAFVLGGTVPHAELIRKLRASGYYTILIDYTENPPAKAEADEHLKASTLNTEEVLELAQEYQIDLIISTCIDQANSTACYVAEKMKLPHPYSYLTSIDVTRKDLMKKIFKENQIPTSDFFILESVPDQEPELPFPLVVKPVDANSSKGVYKVTCLEEYLEKIKYSFEFSRIGKAIVEQFVCGTEIQVDCFANNGKAYVLMTRDKEDLQLEGKELQVAGFLIPGERCHYFQKELQSIAQKIVDAFQLKTTPFFYQAICNENGVSVLEFAPRIAGGTTYSMVEMYSGFPYLDAAIRSFLNQNVLVETEKNDMLYCTRFLYMKPGKFSCVQGIDTLLEENVIQYYFPFIEKGKNITGSLNSGNRVAAITVSGENQHDLKEKIEYALQKIAVIDYEGNDVSFWR